MNEIEIKKKVCTEQSIPVKLPYAGSLRVCGTFAATRKKKKRNRKTKFAIKKH
jgi:hypothetical protein